MTFKDPHDIIEEYKPIIRRIARSTFYSSAAIDANDLHQVGEIAALRAIKAYDPSCGPNIRSFVTRCIRREIYQEAAKFLGVFTVDRRVTSLAAKINKLYIDGHSDESIASIVNKDVDHVRDLRLTYNRHSHTSLINEHALYEDEGSIYNLLTGMIFSSVEHTILLDRILSNLPVQEVANKLNITRARVYALESNLKERIRQAI